MRACVRACVRAFNGRGGGDRSDETKVMHKISGQVGNSGGQGKPHVLMVSRVRVREQIREQSAIGESCSLAGNRRKKNHISRGILGAILRFSLFHSRVSKRSSKEDSFHRDPVYAPGIDGPSLLLDARCRTRRKEHRPTVSWRKKRTRLRRL